MEAQRVADGEAFKQGRIETPEVVANIEQAVLRRSAGLHGAIVSGEVEIH